MSPSRDTGVGLDSGREQRRGNTMKTTHRNGPRMYHTYAHAGCTWWRCTKCGRYDEARNSGEHPAQPCACTPIVRAAALETR